MGQPEGSEVDRYTHPLRSDSTEVIYNEMVDSVSIDGLQAGTGYEFIVYTMDKHGNLSVPTSVTAFPISSSFVEALTPPRSWLR